ncbi:DUF308 domain-containing protein [Fructobacillus sp. M1-13]|uniref:Integral membrane protein n=1 Tax=Fructobacillus papyriferae TaxID=2713171 RepID=A0ABS5QNG0_9LACO|nr:DUF308 domain-containing protein [Fructobacillus papyriferae]MBS9334653.1 hypothetical protein [Fructobacillus papyriferae]MCD2158643.1 DUF308 domain-containing protein [Fructobacillus papyriferae]
MQQYRNERNWWTIAAGALFIIIAFIMISQPLASLLSLTFLFGILAVVHAVILAYEALTDRRQLAGNSGWLMATFILDIVIAFIFLFHWGVGISTIGVFFAIWFIWDAIFEIYMARSVRDLSRTRAFWTTVLGGLSLFFGFILLFSPMLAAVAMVMLVAFYLLAFGMLLLFRAW